MQSQTSKKTKDGTLPTTNPTDNDSGVGSDSWMTERGFTPMTPEESEAHAHFFAPCAKREERVQGNKIIDLIRVLHDAFMRR